MNVSQGLMIVAMQGHPQSTDLGARTRSWMQCGFPQIVLGHKLAASLACTSVPTDFELHAPWKSFLILVPDKLIPCDGIDGESYIEATLIQGNEGSPANDHAIFLGDGNYGMQKTPINDRAFETLKRLMAGVLIELDQPNYETIIREGPKAPSKRRKVPVPKAWTFALTRDVKLDVRAEVRRYCLSGEGVSPIVQSLVRGHHKFQPHGPGQLYRKYIHIEPYWRGPEDAPIAVRSHILQSEP